MGFDGAIAPSSPIRNLLPHYENDSILLLFWSSFPSFTVILTSSVLVCDHLFLFFSYSESSFQAVNELLESLGAPLEIVEGFVNSITVTIPWAALVTEHCTLEITGLQITCRPKYRTSEFCGLFFVCSFGLMLINIVYTRLTYCSIVFSLISVRWKLGFPRVVYMHDVQHAAGPGVPEGPTRGVRRAACSTGGAGNVCTDHRDRCVAFLVSRSVVLYICFVESLSKTVRWLAECVLSQTYQHCKTLTWCILNFSACLFVCSPTSNKSHLSGYHRASRTSSPGRWDWGCLRDAH